MKAAALVLTQVGYNGGSRPPVRQGDKALVIGDGLVGQWLAQMLRHRGARVVLAGRRPERLACAAQWSADLTGAAASAQNLMRVTSGPVHLFGVVHGEIRTTAKAPRGCGKTWVQFL